MIRMGVSALISHFNLGLFVGFSIQDASKWFLAASSSKNLIADILGTRMRSYLIALILWHSHVHDTLLKFITRETFTPGTCKN